MSSNNITGLNDTLELLYAYTLKNNFIYSSSLTLFQGFNRLTVQGYAIGGNYMLPVLRTPGLRMFRGWRWRTSLRILPSRSRSGIPPVSSPLTPITAPVAGEVPLGMRRGF